MRNQAKHSPSQLPAMGTRANLTATMAGDLSRRLFSRRLFLAIPASAALVVAGTDVAEAAPSSMSWSITGNSGTDPTAHFVGTTDNQPLIFKTNTLGRGGERMRITQLGDVGIGTTSPTARLAVETDGVIGVVGRSSSVDAHATGVYGASLRTGVFGLASNDTGTTTGVAGHAQSPAGIGVLGSSPGTGVRGEGTNYGVRGAADGTGVRGEGEIGVSGTSTSIALMAVGVDGSGRIAGVRGYATNSLGQAVGVQGSSTSPDGVGVLGTAGSTSGGVGVRGVAKATGVEGEGITGVSGVSTAVDYYAVGVLGTGRITGVRGVATNDGGHAVGLEGNTSSPDGMGVLGISSSPTGYAGYFQGRVYATGGVTSSAAIASAIDHPLDPANKYLSHAVVAAPEAKNVYDGNITTDANGEATVELPHYCEALNRDFRYQLTVMGRFAQAIVARTIADNQFTIKTDKPNVEVSWQVTGIRNDAYIQAHPIQAEVEKPEYERGTYLAPQEHGQPETLGLVYAQRQARAETITER